MSDCEYPCPCGYCGDALKACTCSPGIVTKYQKRISCPLLDRIDIHIEVPLIEDDKLSRSRVEAARWVYMMVSISPCGCSFIVFRPHFC